MAGKQMLVVLVVAAVSMAVLPAMARATEYVVGNGQGWNIGVNYTEWAQGKVFVVGDSLLFTYAPEVHNVLKVNASNFKACNNATTLGAVLDSGNDTIPLNSTGKHWYICGKPTHCTFGQKLVINVLAAPTPSPTPVPSAPSPTSPTSPVPSGPYPSSPTSPVHSAPSPTSPTSPVPSAPSPSSPTSPVHSAPSPTSPTSPVPSAPSPSTSSGSSNNIMIPEYQSLMVAAGAVLMMTFMI